MDLVDKKNNRFRLVIISILLLMLLKFLFSRNYTAIFSNFFVDSMFLGIIYLLTSLSSNIKFNKISFYLLFIPHFLIFAFNSIFLEDSLVMRYSFNSANWETISFLFKSIIPLKYLIILPLAIGILIWISFKEIPYEKYFLYLSYVLVFIGFVFLIFNPNTISNIYINTLTEEIQTSNYLTLELNYSKNNLNEEEISKFNKELREYDTYNISSNQRILVFVMEQTSYNTFWKDLSKVPNEENFFLKVKKNTHQFNNYYTNNQDSRSTIWTMFNSYLIPFECYIDNWNKKYGYVLGKRNLIDFFNYHNYETHVASSVTQPGLLIGAYNWKDLTFLQEYDENNPNHLCIHSLEYQQGCEDLILIEDVKKVLRRDNLFFLQEFIYGHGEEYENTLGLTRTEYYNKYLFQIYEFLEEENILENTTIFVVSDHGEKGYKDKSLWNYKLPFFVISSNLNYKDINNLHFHMDFKDILLSYVANESLGESEEGFIIGQTGRNEIGYVNKEGFFVGKLDENNIKLKEFNKITTKNILDGIYLLKDFIYYSEEKSLEEDFHCEYCSENIVNSQK